MATSWTSTTRLLSHATKDARDASYRGHQQILDAIALGDAGGAGIAMRRHLDEVSQLNRATLRRRSTR
jgi:DNA-binding FadR family transcriptional regulator